MAWSDAARAAAAEVRAMHQRAKAARSSGVSGNVKNIMSNQGYRATKAADLRRMRAGLQPAKYGEVKSAVESTRYRNEGKGLVRSRAQQSIVSRYKFRRT